MSNSLNKCNAQETAACCCVDVGTVIDNTDCSASYEVQLSTEQEAQTTLQALSDKANQIASEPCKITSSITSLKEGVCLKADFLFSCQAESMIFQLALR